MIEAIVPNVRAGSGGEGGKACFVDSVNDRTCFAGVAQFPAANWDSGRFREKPADLGNAVL